jgi:hypothetical protein
MSAQMSGLPESGRRWVNALVNEKDEELAVVRGALTKAEEDW